jgi:uncharacterized cupin superfamily protein
LRGSFLDYFYEKGHGMTFKIASSDQINWETREQGDFLVYFKRLAQNTHSKQLGTSLYRLPPGSKPFPYHFHHTNEEAMYILEGRGKVRIGGKIYEVKAGDYLGLPVGPDYAHQTINDSDADLVYLCMSTMTAPEVAEYPDSNKLGVITGTAPGHPQAVRAYYPKEADVDYYFREE